MNSVMVWYYPQHRLYLHDYFHEFCYGLVLPTTQVIFAQILSWILLWFGITHDTGYICMTTFMNSVMVWYYPRHRLYLHDYFHEFCYGLVLPTTQVIFAWLLSWILLWFGITHDTGYICMTTFMNSVMVWYYPRHRLYLHDYFHEFCYGLVIPMTQVIFAWLLSWILLWFGITHDTGYICMTTFMNSVMVWYYPRHRLYLHDYFHEFCYGLVLPTTQVILAWLLSWILLWFGITHDTVFMGHWLPYPDPVVKFSGLVLRCLNTLRPRQNGRLFADDTFKRIFLNENIKISIKISLKFVPRGLINNIPALVQIMAWRRPWDKPLAEPMMV